MSTAVANNDQLDKIIAYEEGSLSDDETIDLFQSLVNSGLAWQLHGSYGRTAARMIEQGYITAPVAHKEV